MIETVSSVHSDLSSSRVKRPGKWSISRASLAALLVLITCSAAAASNSVHAPTPARRDYASFKLITERNIFDASRSRTSRGKTETRKTARAETLTLVGTMSYEKGFYAFFDGTSSDHRKTLQPGQSIAGYTVNEVTPQGVKMQNGTNTFELQVGMQLRREGDGPWELASTPARNATPATVSGDSAGEESDIIKRLMQKREQELK